MLIKNCLILLLIAAISYPLYANDLDDGIAIDEFVSDDIGGSAPNMSYIRSKVKAAKYRGDKDIIHTCGGNVDITAPGNNIVINEISDSNIYCDSKDKGTNNGNGLSKPKGKK